MSATSFDTIIIGAGAAGLAAAREFARASRPALLIDARDRVGGRCWSLPGSGFFPPFEFGAEFIHGHAKATFARLREAGVRAVDANGPHWFLEDGRFRPHRHFFVRIRKAMRQIGELETDVSFETLLRTELQRKLSRKVCAFAKRLVEGFDAAEPAHASAKAIIEEWSGAAAADGAQFRPQGGYGLLCGALVEGLAASEVRLQLNTVVTAVKWQRNHVEIEGRFIEQPFRLTAKRAIITLPLGVLQASAHASGTVRFTPSLSAKRRALALLAPGAALKVGLRFHSAFWEEIDGGRYRDVAFFHSDGNAFSTVWSTLPVRTPMLTAWSGGPVARRLSRLGAPQIVRHALKGVERIFGRRAVTGQLQGAWLHNWQRDPFARGAYSYVKVGGTDAHGLLAAPLEQTLFFAGEAAAAEGEAGTVAGALQSGARAAREVLGAA